MFSLEDIKKFIRRYSPHGLIVDTEILILFLTGSCNPTFIKECRLTNKYSVNDFEILKEIFNFFKNIVITPQVIAELSNLSITGKYAFYDKKLILYIQKILKFFETIKEEHQKIDCLLGTKLEIIGKYGSTDMTMFELSKKTKMPIITNDLPFFYYSNGKIPIIKFGYIIYQKYQKSFR